MDWERLNVNFGDNHKSAVIVSEKLTRKELYNLYLRFIRYQKKMDRYTDIKRGLKDPIKAVRYFVGKIS
jgi:hypothetical protein